MVYKLYRSLWYYDNPSENGFGREGMQSIKRGIVVITGSFILALFTIRILAAVYGSYPFY